MHTTADLLDEFKRAHGIESDYALARFLDVRKQVVSRYRTGVHTLGPDLAFRIADDLGMDRGYVLACMAAERAQSEPERQVWRRLAERLAGIAAAVLVAFSATLQTSERAIAPFPELLVSLSDTGAAPLCIMTNGAGMLILALVGLRILRRQP
jgi:hypothetical protein